MKNQINFEMSDDEVIACIKSVPRHFASVSTTIASAGFVNPTAATINMDAVPNNQDNLATFEVSGTFTGATALFEGTNDGTNWSPLAAIRADTGALETTPTVSNSTNRIWKVDITGLMQARMKFTALSTGSITVVGLSRVQVNPNPLGLNNSLVSSATNLAVSGTLAVTGASTFSSTVNIADAQNVVLGTTTGTIVGTATTQKLAFYNATPVVQPIASTNSTTGTTGASTGVSLDTTFKGAAGSSAYTVGGIVTQLKALGLIAA